MSLPRRCIVGWISFLAVCLLHAPRVYAKPCTVGRTAGWSGYHQTLEVGPITIVLKDVKTKDGKKYRVVRGYRGDKFLGEQDIPIDDADEAYKKCLDPVNQDFKPDWFGASAALKAVLRSQAVAAPDAAVAALTADADDLDGDGIVDLVKTNFNPPGVAVRLGNADGSFRVQRAFPTGPGAEAVRLADFNGDGQPDLAVAHQGDFQQDAGGLSILIGNRDATFAAATRYEAGRGPHSLAVADFNADGKLDVATANSGSLGTPNLPADTGGVSVLLGNGDGTLAAATALQAGNTPWSIAAPDMNGDGRADLVVANYQSASVSVLLGNGNGTFGAAINTAVGPNPSYLGATDLNGDGRLDVVVLHRNGTLSTWFGGGNGTLQAGGRYVAGSSIEAFAILESEENLRPFLLVPDQPTNSILIMGVNLDGSLVSPRAYMVDTNAVGLAVGDFNGDGRMDAALADGQNISLLLGQGSLRMAQPQPIAVTGGGPLRSASIASADFDGDGRSDLAAVSGGQLSVLRSAGDGTFQRTGVFNTAPGAGPVAAMDLNGDGSPDLAVANNAGAQSGVSVFVGDGAGGFQARRDYPTGHTSRSLASGDLNGDGRGDLAVANLGNLGPNTGTVSVLLSNADGSLRPAVNYPAGFAPGAVAAGDFNGDGHVDLVAGGQLNASFDFGIALLPGNGDGTFGAPSTTLTDFGPTSIAAADLDRDGTQDLAVAHCCGVVAMTLLLGNGNGTFRAVSFPGGQDPIAVTAADFDGDQALDLAVLAGGGTGSSGYAMILPNTLSPFVNVPATGGIDGFVAPDSIVSAYGARLANTTTAAPSPAWPGELGGTSVRVRDSAGVERNAGVAFSSPGQVNYHMPPETAEGNATVTITSGDGVSNSATIGIERISPGLFTVNADRLAAALVIRARANGEQVVEAVVQVNAANQVVPAPIDLGEETDRMILLLYGTGLRLNSGAHSVRVQIGGVDAPVHYAGAQGEFPGLDQLNVEIPRSLRGSGLVDVVVTVDGEEALPLRIRVQ